MPLPLPDLDTRRWSDLVAEVRGLIPTYAPDWTDVNVSDPGVTVLELLAFVVEQDIYRANRVPPHWRARLLALAGYAAAGPQPATVVLALGSGTVSTIEAGTTLLSATGIGVVTSTSVSACGAQLTAVHVDAGAGAVDATGALAAGTGIAPFGDDPTPGAAIRFGLSGPLPTSAPVSIWMTVATSVGRDPGPAPHHGAHTAWEVLAGGADAPRWDALQVVRDDTRALTRSGLVVLVGPPVPGDAPPGVPDQQSWLRCRFTAGAFDVAPRLLAVTLDAAPARQEQPLAGGWRLAPGATASGLPADPGLGESTRFAEVRLEPTGLVERLVLDAAGSGPLVQVAPPRGSDDPGLLAALVGRADGGPELELDLPGAGASLEELEVWTADEDGWSLWQPLRELSGAGPGDRVVALDPAGARLRFGDGAAGVVPPVGAAVIALGRRTGGTAGNVAAGTVWRPAGSAPGGIEIRNPAAGTGGTDAEDIAAVAARAVTELAAQERLVEIADGAPTLDQLDPAIVLATPVPARAATALDLERVALDVPGTAVARARAWPGVDVDLPGLLAPGTVSVIVVPHLPAGRPEPSEGLLDAVRRELVRRRVVGTRLVVRGPSYVLVAVTATLVAQRGADPGRVGQAVATALDTLLDPLTGGPAGRGWPFGRTVNRAELLHVIDAVAGVDYVAALEISGDGRSVGCDDLPISPRALASPGTHQITVRKG